MAEDNPGPAVTLPIGPDFINEHDYVDELLAFSSKNETLQLLTSSVHVLDFFTRDPGLYETVLPESWRQWCARLDVPDILDFVLRDDLSGFGYTTPPSELHKENGPPRDLVEYVWGIRRLLLARVPKTVSQARSMPYHIALGMKTKKVHEVGQFSQYVDHLASRISNRHGRSISHLVDFGAGQNYLGRALANDPINRNVVAVESRIDNVESAKRMDLPAIKLAAKLAASVGTAKHVSDVQNSISPTGRRAQPDNRDNFVDVNDTPDTHDVGEVDTRHGSIQYIGQSLDSGDLSHVIEQLQTTPNHGSKSSSATDNEHKHQDVDETNLMVISLHSCGNLSHHGLRSLTQNPEVSAVAIVGCCYNLVTERLSTPLCQSDHSHISQGRLHDTAGDPLGFPMSDKFMTYPVRPDKQGFHLNLTTRMMAVQAPCNWTLAEFNDFTTRHFYRSLFQKVLVDYHIIPPPPPNEPIINHGYVAGGDAMKFSAASGNTSGPQIVVGKLGKKAYLSFSAYVRTALQRLIKVENADCAFRKLDQTIDEQELKRYEAEYAPRRKDMGILWTLMAYSAGIAEALVVVDRWQWLREQDDVAECWVEPVFDYAQSPRNLVVVGIKK